MGPLVKSLLKKTIKNAFWLSVAYYLVSDLIARARFSAGDIGTMSGTLHSELSEADSIAYIEDVFEDYRRYSGVSDFYGKIAEIGPGDNCGVGMLLRHSGAEWVDLVDRFYSKRNEAAQAGIYRTLIGKYPALKTLIGDADLANEASFGLLRRHYGENAAAERFFAMNTGYDFIVSRAVFEHLYDPLLALRGMVAALKPGGYLLHKVDLRDHGMFSGGFHELKFLEVPGGLYHCMTSASGRPNRVLVHAYRSTLNALGMKSQYLVTRLAGVGEILPHRPYEEIDAGLRSKAIAFVQSVRSNFAASFHDVSDEDLSVAGLFLVAKKPQLASA